MTTNPARPTPNHLLWPASTPEVFGAVAVVSDGSGMRHRGRAVTAASVYPVLADYATLIADVAGLRGCPVAVAAPDAACLAAALGELDAGIGAIFLTHTDPRRARVVQRAVREAGGLPVVTDQDTTAIALAAAVLTTLRRVDRPPSVSRVVIAGAQAMPVLCPLLMSAGVGDLISWNEVDAPGFPLYRVTQDVDVIVDLLDGAPVRAEATQDRGRAVIAPDDPACHLIALPGLLTAVLQTPAPVLDVGLFRVCALTLALTTPQGRLLPELTDPVVTDNLARAATHELRHPRYHR